MDFSKEIILLVLGGGASWILKDGVAAILKIKAGRAAKEDSALQQWKDLAKRHERGERRAWALVRAYRTHYGALRAAYYQQTADRLDFPVDPEATVPEAPLDED